MHQTTVRFGPDLWSEIATEARRAGVSVAQYVRDSALMRVSYTRGRDGDPHYEAALELVGDADDGPAPSSTTGDDPAMTSEDAQTLRHAGALRAGARRRDRAADAPPTPQAEPPAGD
jgi:hypothetical protein